MRVVLKVCAVDAANAKLIIHRKLVIFKKRVTLHTKNKTLEKTAATLTSMHQ